MRRNGIKIVKYYKRYLQRVSNVFFIGLILLSPTKSESRNI